MVRIGAHHIAQLAQSQKIDFLQNDDICAAAFEKARYRRKAIVTKPGIEGDESEAAGERRRLRALLEVWRHRRCRHRDAQQRSDRHPAPARDRQCDDAHGKQAHVLNSKVRKQIERPGERAEVADQKREPHRAREQRRGKTADSKKCAQCAPGGGIS